MINEFRGQYRWLSNFWPATVKFELFGRQLVADNVESAFQASKPRRIGEAMWVLEATTPGDAKRRGRKVDLRADWDEVKVNVMLALLRSKFSDPTLRTKLLATREHELVEGNRWHDNFFGVCSCAACSRGLPGQNMLGKLLMQVRGELRTKEKTITLNDYKRMQREHFGEGEL